MGRDVDNPREHDHFERIELHQDNEKSRRTIAMYLEHMAEYHERVEKNMHMIGKLDERLGA
jgi:hypothetical protein